MRGLSMIMMGYFFFAMDVSAGSQFGVGHKVIPCPRAPRTTPVTRSCVAAAIAEEAYLNSRHNNVEHYTLFLHGRTKPTWSFLIEQGDENHPPAPDSHWFVNVDRATGKAIAVRGVL